MRECGECGNSFDAKVKTQKYCTKACGSKNYQKRWKGYTKTCKGCEADYTTKHPTQLYCSRECGYKSPLQATYSGPRISDTARSIRRMAVNARSMTRQRNIAAKREAKIDLLTKPDIPCDECQSPIDRFSKSRRYCSLACSRRLNSRIGKSKRRAVIRGARIETVDPMTVFDRDGWHCQLCEVETPITLRGTYEDNAPELDHIYPLSKGGGHSYANTQCLCRLCNRTKSDSVVLPARKGYAPPPKVNILMKRERRGASPE